MDSEEWEEFVRKTPGRRREAEAGRYAGRGLSGKPGIPIHSTRNLDEVLQMTPQNGGIWARWLDNKRVSSLPSLPHLQRTKKRQHLCWTSAQGSRPCQSLLAFHVGTRENVEYMGSCPHGKGDLPSLAQGSPLLVLGSDLSYSSSFLPTRLPRSGWAAGRSRWLNAHLPHTWHPEAGSRRQFHT